MEPSSRPEKPVRNPFRSEQDAFRVLVYVLVAGLIVLLAATLISTWLGVVLAIVAVAVALIKIVTWLSELLGDPDEPDQPDPRHQGQ